MRLFKKVAIVGVGLIGGSLGMAIKKKKYAAEVVGVSRQARSLEIARKRHAIDRGSRSLSVIKDADCVILSTPVSVILRQAAEIARLISADCIVTDVGSTKREIVAALENTFPRYVGSHPLAGSEKRSVMHAQPDLFEGSLCIMTPTRKTDSQALRSVEMLWRKVGARPIRMAAAAHDNVLSFVSHLPHAAAFALVNSVPEKYFGFAAGGLKDTTRIAASQSRLWIDILLSNRLPVLKAIDTFQKNISGIQSAIKSNDRSGLARIVKKAQEKRERLGK